MGFTLTPISWLLAYMDPFFNQFNSPCCTNQNYPQVCGRADVDGDFIVPTAAAHLDGAVNLEVEGAFHSPLGSKLSFLGPW